MEEKKFFTLSDKASNEYCCCVVRIGEVKPIEGTDFLATTDVYGTQIVVRKDQVKEGDIMFYAMNETELNAEFLHDNNLFEISSRDMNANAAEVNAIMENYEINYKSKAEPLRAKLKNYRKVVKSLTTACEKLNKEIKNHQKKLENETDEAIIKDIQAEIEKKQGFCDQKTADALAMTTKITNLKNEIDSITNAGKHIVEQANKMCGFFNQYGRVRCLTLKGEPSFGYLFSKDELAKYNPKVLNVNIEDYLEKNFDTVDGVLFVKAYVPRVKEQTAGGSRERKRNKKITHLDRMIDGQFYFHYDTTPLDTRVMKNFFTPEQTVAISVKIHGCVEYNTLVKTKEFGELKIGDIVRDKIKCHILARDLEADKDIFVPIDDYYTIPNDGEWYEIELEDGTKINITGNNPVWLPIEKAYRKVEDLKGDEYLLLTV